MALKASVGGLTPSVLLALIWLSIAIAILFTIARTAIKLDVSRRLSLDDGFVYLALAILIAMGAMYKIITPTMFEIDQPVTPGAVPSPELLQQATLFLKMQFAIIVLFWSTLWSVKFSFLLYYKSLFANLPGLLVWWWFVSGFTLLAYLGCWATQLASCKPIHHYFTLGACETKRDIWVSNFSLYYATVVDILCDILIMALPLRLLWNLQINRQEKSALAAIFSVGVIIIIFAIVRVVETSASTNHVDPVWLALWSIIEASVAVVVSCLPSFRVLLNTRTSRSNSAYNRRNNSGSRSRSRCSSGHGWRLKYLRRSTPADGRATISLGSNGGRSGGCNSSLPTEHFAGAERVDPYDTDAEAGERIREDGSKEYILPKLHVPKDSVHVRRDVVVDFS